MNKIIVDNCSISLLFIFKYFGTSVRDYKNPPCYDFVRGVVGFHIEFFLKFECR